MYAYLVRIAYITHTRFPTEKAHGHQIAHVCAAMGALKHSVTLLAPTIGNPIKRGAFAYYGIQKTFAVEHLQSFDALSSRLIPGKIAFWVSMRSYRRALAAHLKSHKYDLLYARSPAILKTLVHSGRPTVIELHTLPKRKKKKFVSLCNRCKKIVCLTHAMADELTTWGVNKKKIMVEGDAVDPANFAKPLSAKKAKHHWDLPEDRTVIGYVGSLVTFDKLQKGVNILVDAVSMLRNRKVPVFLWVVGGPKHWQTKYRKLALMKGLSHDDFRFHDPVLAHHVPDVLSACDICVYPAPHSRHKFFMRDTSPLKLFEYLAAGKPVVCADIPPVRDVVDKSAVRLVHPGSAKSLLGGITDIMEKRAEAKKRVTEGLKIVQDYTWEKRMKRILTSL